MSSADTEATLVSEIMRLVRAWVEHEVRLSRTPSSSPLTQGVMERTFAAEEAFEAAVTRVVAERDEAVLIANAFQAERAVAKPTQEDWLVQWAKDHGGMVRISEARPAFIAAGLTEAKPRNIYGNMMTVMERSEHFEQIDTGTFRCTLRHRTHPQESP